MSVRVSAAITSCMAIVFLIAMLAADANVSVDATTGAAVNATARQSAYVGIGSYALAAAIWSSLTPRLRAAIHGRVNRWAMAGEAGRAAGIAAMVGQLEPGAVLTLARRHFRALPRTSLCRMHFDSESDASSCLLYTSPSPRDS